LKLLPHDESNGERTVEVGRGGRSPLNVDQFEARREEVLAHERNELSQASVSEVREESLDQAIIVRRWGLCNGTKHADPVLGAAQEGLALSEIPLVNRELPNMKI